MGPLSGIRVLEFGAIGPAPFCAMLLADMGAEVLRIERPGGKRGASNPRLLERGKQIIELDLKSPADHSVCLSLLDRADALIEGYRPGVMERLGLGPDVALGRQPKIIYGRMTGWGQSGTLAHAAGHDINYIALTGALDCIGSRNGPPVPPLNLVGDMGGGALYLALGIVAAILEARSSGQGQVVDAAITDGVASLMSFVYGMKADGYWDGARGDNIADGGAPWYTTYETADHLYVSVGAVEPQFYSLLLERLGLDEATLPDRNNRANWPLLHAEIASAFAAKSRAEWCSRLEGSDVCFAPVLSLDDAHSHPHNASRQTFLEMSGIAQPAPAPRFSRTPSTLKSGSRPPLQAVLARWGLQSDDTFNGPH